MNLVGSDKKRKGKLLTLYIVRVALLAAMLTAGKLALSFIPNVEIVTLLVIVYGSALGVGYALPATLIFCAVEMAIYGVGSWNILYFAYWPLLGVVASFLRGRRLPLAIVIGVVGSVLFGALDAAIYTLIIAANMTSVDLGKYFVVYYLRGIPFDIAHVVSSLATVALLYAPLVKGLKTAAKDAYLRHAFKSSLINRPYVYVRVPREGKAVGELSSEQGGLELP